MAHSFVKNYSESNNVKIYHIGGIQQMSICIIHVLTGNDVNNYNQMATLKVFKSNICHLLLNNVILVNLGLLHFVLNPTVLTNQGKNASRWKV